MTSRTLRRARTTGGAIHTRATEGEGRFSALVSAYGIRYAVDGGREVIRKGAFAEAPDRVPVYVQHNHKNGGAPIGVTTRTFETARGLQVEGKLYVDESPEAAATYKSLKDGGIREWSIGFLADDDGTKRLRDGTVAVVKAELRETSAVLVGANPATETLSVRSFIPTGRTPDDLAHVAAAITGGITASRRQHAERAAARAKLRRVLEALDRQPGENGPALYRLAQTKRFRSLLERAA